MSDPNLYMDQGIEYTKRFENSNQLVKVKLSKHHHDEFFAVITVMQNDVQTTKIKIRLQPQDVNLSVAETLAIWGATAPFACYAR